MPSLRAPLQAFAVALVLADSSAVTLALPEILREFDASVGGVSWVLVSFNLALASAALPAAGLAVRRPSATLVAGLLAFAAAGAACAFAPSLAVLIAARALQGISGAAVVAGAFSCMLADRERDAAVASWAAAGLFGAVVGPAAGGLLTEALSWEAMFAVQVPLALAAIAGAPRPEPARAAAAAPRTAAPRHDSAAGPRRERPAVGPLVSLALISAALAAALFLVVLLLIEGWGHSPAHAAAVVTAMPLAALAGAALARRGLPAPVAGAGIALIAGGLAALGLMPAATDAWTLPAQLLIGAGLGLAIAGLTAGGLAGRSDPAWPAAWTIAARHAGVVAGLVLLTPVFAADLRDQTDRTEAAALAHVLDARLSVNEKVELGGALQASVVRADGRLPALGPAFEGVDAPPQELERLRAELDDELDRGGTAAFSRSFLAAAGLALLALVPLLLGATSGAGRRAAARGATTDAGRRTAARGATTDAGRRTAARGAPIEAGRRSALGDGRRTTAIAVVGGLAASAVLATVHLAAGGGGFEPTRVADPCAARARPPDTGRIQRAALPVLDGAACELGTSREALVLSLASGDGQLLRDDERVQRALEAGIDRARGEDAVGALEAAALRFAVRNGLADVLLDALLG